MVRAEAALEEPLAEARPRWGTTTLGRLVRKRLAMVCLAIIAIVYLAGILAPWVAPYAYDDQDLDNTYAGPSLSHPLGTDELGRDMLSRVIWAAQTTASRLRTSRPSAVAPQRGRASARGSSSAASALTI